MTSEIVQQGPGYTIYRTTDWGPAVPYPAVERPDSSNHGFIDLRDRPELIDFIPECQKSPGLTSIVKAINRKGSPLMTLGCEHYANEISPPEGKLTCSVGSYTDLTFRDGAMHATEEQLVELAIKFLNRLHFKPVGPLSFELGIQRMRHFFGSDGYNLCLVVSGAGSSDKEASNSYEVAASAAATAFGLITID